MFKGTQRYRLGEIARTLFLNGARFNANTYYDWTNYYSTIAADRLELAMSSRPTGWSTAGSTRPTSTPR